MKPLVFAFLATTVLSSTAFAETYKMDPGHTEIRFHWNHAGVSDQSGEWGVVDGTIDFDPENLEATKASIQIQADSVFTGVEGLDTHLKSADFFEVEKFPVITFESTGVKQTGAQSVILTGDLTIKDQSKPITIDVSLNFQGAHPLGAFVEYYEGDWIGVSASGSLLRSDFGVGQFAPLTSDSIRLEISSEMRAGGWPE